MDETINLWNNEEKKDDLKTLNNIQEKANNIAIALKIKNWFNLVYFI